MLMSVLSWLVYLVWNPVTTTICAVVGLFAALSYLLPIVIIGLLPVPDLKKKYSADWALVTGSSSGIGKSVARRLAQQGLNVVIVSLDDELLASTIKELKKEFPSQQFRQVGVDLSPGQPYLERIVEATKDIEVQLIFNNAGYIVTGFFEQSPLAKQLANLECNATAAVKITHHFSRKLVHGQRPGCIVFTSSAAACVPSPFSCLYGATKAFLSQFAASLAVELRPCGIDVVAIHPSPVMTRFYDKAHKMEMLDFAKLFAVGPEQLPDEIFRSIGRCHWRDIGGFAIVMRLAMMSVSYNMAAWLFSTFGSFLPDFKKYAPKRMECAKEG